MVFRLTTVLHFVIAALALARAEHYGIEEQLMEAEAAEAAGLVDPLPTTFGSAHKFCPMPGTTVGAHYQWEVRMDTVLGRVPSTLTEIVCRNPNSHCGGNTGYSCRQIRTRLVVAYVDVDATTGYERLTMSNKTVNLGCSCVKDHGVYLREVFQLPLEKKKRGGIAIEHAHGRGRAQGRPLAAGGRRNHY